MVDCLAYNLVKLNHVCSKLILLNGLAKTHEVSSLVPRPSTPPVFDRFQYKNWRRRRPGNEARNLVRFG